MLGNLIGPEINELIAARNFSALREAFVDWSPADIAECITDLPAEEQAVLFRLLPHALAGDVFEYLDTDAQHAVLRAMGNVDAARILNDMSADDRTGLLEELPGAAVAQLLQLLSPEEKAIAQSLLNYPEDSVGRRMTPEFISVRSDWTIQQVLDHIRAHGKDSETLNVVYVTDERGRLIDDVRIREFLLRPLETRVDEIHDSSFVALHATDPEEDAVNLFKRYDRNTLPVVDSENKLLGIVTVDDMLDIQEEEATEDIQKLGGVAALEEPYMDAPLFDLVRKRAVWLVVLFLGQMLTATVMGVFEKELASALVLALFIPLIISSGGNSGSQASTLIIRAMSLGEIKLRDWWKVMKREIASGLLLGGLLAGIGFLRIVVWSSWSDSYGPHFVRIGLTVSVAILGVVLWGTLSGAMLPLLLRRMGLDPATSSAPFVATLVDVTGLIIYFSAAVLILRGTVL
ncbi:MAG TPA: magnesium transporter [Chthoniobacteraceae bacterium]|jgi:magnesium transporter|nr:Mg2+ transporter MgtE [Chthoniobacter sp.]HEV7867499.1 magnesium transporter [Chthoniobacteraceae bacterium]